MRNTQIMNSFVLPVCLLMFVQCHEAVTGLSQFEGTWKGDLTIRDETQEIFVTVKEDGKDTFNVYYDIPKANMHHFFMGDLVRRDSLYRLGLVLVNEITSNEIKGTYRYYEKAIPVRLFRTDNRPEKPQVLKSGKSKRALWTFQTDGEVWSSPQVTDGKILFGSTDGKLYALNESNGSLLWYWDAKAPIKGDVTIKGDYVYFLAGDGILHKLTLKDGIEAWSFNTINEEVASKLSSYDDYYSMPVIDNGIIYIGSRDHNLYALDVKSGNEIWRFNTTNAIISAPAVDDGKVFVGSMDQHLYSIEIMTGELDWKFDTHGPITSRPLVWKDLIIIGSRNSDLYGVNRNSGNEQWVYSYWTSWVESSGVLVDDRLYIGSSDSGNIYCLNPTNGEEHWTSFVGGSPWGNPIVSGDKVYSGVIGSVGYSIDHKGAFVCLDRMSGQEQWRIDYDPLPEKFNYGVYSTPAISNGMIYFGSLDGLLYAVEE